jgi:hypothetical protein
LHEKKLGEVDTLPSSFYYQLSRSLPDLNYGSLRYELGSELNRPELLVLHIPTNSCETSIFDFSAWRILDQNILYYFNYKNSKNSLLTFGQDILE